MKLLLVACCVLLLASSVHAIRCYVCVACATPSGLSECYSGVTQCIKLTTAGVVSRSCGLTGVPVGCITASVSLLVTIETETCNCDGDSCNGAAADGAVAGDGNADDGGAAAGDAAGGVTAAGVGDAADGGAAAGGGAAGGGAAAGSPNNGVVIGTLVAGFVAKIFM